MVDEVQVVRLAEVIQVRFVSLVAALQYHLVLALLHVAVQVHLLDFDQVSLAWFSPDVHLLHSGQVPQAWFPPDKIAFFSCSLIRRDMAYHRN